MGLRVLSVLRRRPIASALTLGVVASIGLLYTEAVFAHLSVYQLPTSQVGLSGFRLVEDGTAVEGLIRFENAASREIVFYGANIMLTANGTTIAGPASTSTDQTTVPAGGTVRVTARVDFAEGRARAGAVAYRNGSLLARGVVYAGFGDQTFQIGIDPQPIGPSDADGGGTDG